MMNEESEVKSLDRSFAPDLETNIRELGQHDSIRMLNLLLGVPARRAQIDGAMS
jgi:hypothetical protein